MGRFLVLSTLAAFLCGSVVQARVNATGAIEVFMITDCNACVSDKNSIFCSEAAADDNFASNGSITITIKKKKQILNSPADGAKYCWMGTFGKLLNNEGSYVDMLGSDNVTAKLGCNDQSLFYRQCVIPQQLTYILMSVGGFLFITGTTCICFYCGCCKCCNLPGDNSKWGCCNRFCPWMPCSDPPVKEEKEPEWRHNPVTEEQHKSSLFGRNPAFKQVELSSAKKTDRPGGTGGTGLTGSSSLTGSGPTGQRKS